jgi:hypothetical protein
LSASGFDATRYETEAFGVASEKPMIVVPPAARAAASPAA